MTRRVRYSLIAGVSALAVALGTVTVSVSRVKRQLEEKARASVVGYLEKRFDSRVEFRSLQINFARVASLSLFLRRGRGVLATVDGYGLVLHQRLHPEAPPFFRITHFRFFLDAGLLAGPVKTVPRVEVEGMDITVPPKGQRSLRSGAPGDATQVTLGEVLLRKTGLTLLPRDGKKPPLHFDIDDLLLTDAGPTSAMTYKAHLTNPRPPGRIEATGHFGPWNAAEPGDTSLDGQYRFDDADLSVFGGIRGILSSTGTFSGALGYLEVSGEARVPAFALKSAGNPIPLETRFDAVVDGTNGDTILKPVQALLGGKTRFVTNGAILKHEEIGRRAVELNAVMKGGDLREVLRLGMKGKPFMKGTLQLKTKISIPPLSGKVRQKLGLIGDFTVTGGMFLRDDVQDKIDDLSRRGQGKPGNASIDDVVHDMSGHFDMENEVVTLSDVTFGVPGANVLLNGSYDIASDQVDFHGELRLDAKVSQTLTGWKRWFAKPIDPFFAKDGAGTLLRIQISGSAANPEFGLDHGPKSKR